MGGAKMSQLTVYHGGTDIIERPICLFGRPNLDFGRGFYVTDLREQALQWASQMATRRGLPPVLNRYLLNKDAIASEARCRVFDAYNADWLMFIVANRNGRDISRDYDYIEGGIANDRVIDTINLYIAGLMDVETALMRLAQHRPNNQMCLLNQEITDKYLIFDGTECIE